jgi:hypothetical protein
VHKLTSGEMLFDGKPLTLSAPSELALGIAMVFPADSGDCQIAGATAEKLVIFDEPTRGVTVGAIVEIHQLINRPAGDNREIYRELPTTCPSRPIVTDKSVADSSDYRTDSLIQPNREFC